MPRNMHPIPFIIHLADDLVFKQPELKRLSFALSQKYADRQLVTEADLRAMGGALWSMLTQSTQNEFDAAHTIAGTAILPVIIESSKVDVQALPWETLFHPTLGFIGKHPAFTLTRRIKAIQNDSINLDKGPLRVLLFTSLPEDVNPEKGRLNVEEEQAQVQEALLPWISKGLVELEMPDDGRFSTLKEMLKSFQPHVLFLSGHGIFHHEPHTGEAPYGEFLFENEAGDGEGVREDKIAEALIGTQVQVVVLSACESGKAASDELANGLTQRISAQGISHVIGMRESVLDMAGIQFARTLCDELAGQERIDVALQTARIAIHTPFKKGIYRDVGNGAIAELSLGQWCLPMLVSSNPQNPLIEWNFTPQEIQSRAFNRTLNTVRMPARFVGRRVEMRKYKNDLLNGKIHQLLITGPGGQGKTSLAGKLALDMQSRGYQIFAWSARPENSWREFEFEMELALDEARAKKYDYFKPRFENDRERANFMLGLLMEQFNGQVILFLDNLETLQDEETRAIKDPLVAAWMEAALSSTNLIVLATSRWQLPNWNGEHLALTHASYGDFLQMAQELSMRKQLPSSLLEKHGQMRRVYAVLGGNSRGLEFFAAAASQMQNPDEEDSFLETLANTKKELQANMAIATIYSRLPAEAKKLLQRLPAYHEPVPAEGIIKLGLDLPDPEALLDRLLAVSLLEAGYEPHWEVMQYQCAPLVMDWLGEQGLTDNNPTWLNTAADFHLYLHRYERRILSQAILAHHALRRAERTDEADRLTLDYIVGPLTMAGFYATLLSEWLRGILNSRNLQTRAEALGQTGKILYHLGDYQNALSFLKQSLTVRQQIGDKAGEGATLNNIATSYQAQGDYETALSYLKQSLTIMQQIGDKAGEGATINNIANSFYAQGDYETALSYLKQSLTIMQQIGDLAGEGATINNVANIYQAQGDYETALSYLKQSLTIRQQIGDKKGEGTTLNNISQIYDAQGDYETALSYLKQSLIITQQIGDKAGEGATLNNIANSFYAQGDYETALSYLKQSLTVRQQIGDKAGEGTTLNNISALYHAQGDYETALSYLKQSLTIQQQIGDLAGEGATINNVANIYHAQGDYETALSYLKQSLIITQQIGDKKGEGTLLYDIAQIFLEHSYISEAYDFFTKAKNVFKEIGDKRNFSKCLLALGNTEAVLGNLEKARWHYKDALDYKIDLDKPNLANLLVLLGVLELRMGFSAQALNHLLGAKEEFDLMAQQEKVALVENILAQAQEISMSHEKSKNWASKIIKETLK